MQAAVAELGAAPSLQSLTFDQSPPEVAVHSSVQDWVNEADALRLLDFPTATTEVLAGTPARGSGTAKWPERAPLLVAVTVSSLVPLAVRQCSVTDSLSLTPLPVKLTDWPGRPDLTPRVSLAVTATWAPAGAAVAASA